MNIKAIYRVAQLPLCTGQFFIPFGISRAENYGGVTESSCPKPKDKDCVRHPRPPSPPNQMQINKDKNERLGIECDKMDRNMATTRAEMIAEAKANGNLNVLC